jgi:hypothetical protein
MSTTTKKIPTPVALKNFAEKNDFFVISKEITSNGKKIKFYHLLKNYNYKEQKGSSKMFFISSIPDGELKWQATSQYVVGMDKKMIKATTLTELTTKLAKYL